MMLGFLRGGFLGIFPTFAITGVRQR